MTTLTLTLDLADKSGIQLAVDNLMLLLGKVPAAPAPAGSGSKGTATPAAARAATATSTPAAASAQAPQQGAAGSPAVTFDEVKKAFLALSTKPNGRALCESVLKPFSLGKLSEAKADQYGAVLVEIQKLAAVAN